MPRYPRITGVNAFYHIFNRGIEKMTIYKDKRDYQKFLEYLEKYSKKYDWIIYCYCLLPNHYHLLIQTRNDPLGLIMKSLQTAFGVYFNKKYKRVGPVFSGRYKSVICQKDEYLLQVSKYIHLNPVKAQLSKTPYEYPYSSYREYIPNKNEIPGLNLIDKRVMKRLLGESINEKSMNMYKSFVEEQEDLLQYNPFETPTDTFGKSRFTLKYKRNRKIQQSI